MEVDRRTAARLAAVQTIYAALVSGDFDPSRQEVVFTDDSDTPGPSLSKSRIDKRLYRAICSHWSDNMDQLLNQIKEALGKDHQQTFREKLLLSIMTCALAERRALPDAQTALIISEALKITESFFDTPQVKLVHGILSKVL